MSQQDTVLTSTQAARELGIDRSTAFRAAASGQVAGARRDPRPGAINAPWVATRAAWRYWYEHRRPAGRPPRGALVDSPADLVLLIQPETCKTVTPAELSLDGTRLMVTFPELREDFRGLIRSLGYRWTGYSWSRSLQPQHGEPLDRAAETGHRLLAAGFPVRFRSELVRDHAVAAQYQPEPVCWVHRLTDGPYAGWFLIGWPRNANLYDAAKAIAGSRYVKGEGVAIPPEHFDEAMDFAGLYGAYVSPGAQQLAEEARAARRVVTPPRPRRAKAKSMERQDLAPPEEVSIDDELRDEDETP